MHRLIPLAAALILVGCAGKPTVSENQCKAGDWQSIGFRDGASGYASTRILNHQEACGEFGIVPERGSYLSGWQDGVTTYCTADNGFQLGLRGRALNTVCSQDLREPFASAHADGRKLYIARGEVNRLSNLLASHENRLVAIKEEMVGATTAQLVPDLSAEERIRLLAKLEALAEERTTIKNEIPQIELSLADAEHHLAMLDQMYAAR